MNVGERDNHARRIWGMNARQLHDCYWASRGVQAVRQRHSHHPQVPEARLYLLLDRHTMVLFPPRRFTSGFRWPAPGVVLGRVQHQDREAYQELVTTGEDGQLLRFERCYDRSTPRAVRIGVTPSRRLAELWQRASGARSIGRFLRNNGYGDDLQTVAIDGDIYDAACEHDQRRLLCDLVRTWLDPGASFVNVRRLGPHIWAHADAKIDPRTRFIGPAWVGAGHTTEGVMSVLGPAVLWDEEKKCDGAGSDRLTELSLLHHTFTSSLRHCAIARRPSFYPITKRLFDIVVSLLALAVTLPLYLLVMLVIWLEDGRPFLFVHRREAHGGREFGCLKFRTMRKDAEATKEQLAEQNRCDGPQFFIPRDPRVTRVGTFLRKYHIDEWPQFLNVLRGEMSLVGPRPSPFAENQFCPTWREARLSVPPGITGLWQVSRTRSSGNDFREWIEFDLQYVQQRGWKMDLYILWRTAVVVFFPHRAHRRATERGGGLSTTSPAVGSV